MCKRTHYIDNGYVEGLRRIFLRERYHGSNLSYKESFVQMFDDYVRYYNTRGIHRNLGFFKPAEKHEQFYQAT